MSVLKRSVDDVSDDSDDAGTFQQQALEICLPDENFDPSVLPTSGEEFLTYMAYERKNTPAIISRRPAAKKLATASKQVLPFYIDSIKNDEECAAHGREFINKSYAQYCSESWKQKQLQHFAKTRVIANAQRNKDYQDIQQYGGIQESNMHLKFCNENPPLLKYILCYEQRELEQLLEYMCEWLQRGEQAATATPTKSVVDNDNTEETSNEEIATNAIDDINLKVTTLWLGQWIYAMLVALHLPLEPEVHSNLREMARIFVRQRGRLNMTNDNLSQIKTYNIFIHLIANYFGQLDFSEFV